MRKQIIDNVDIELPEFDANELNSLMYEMVEAFVYALGHQSNRKTKGESSELLQASLRVFVVTHKSMLGCLHKLVIASTKRCSMKLTLTLIALPFFFCNI